MANLTATGVASAPGLATVTLTWQETAMGPTTMGYDVVVSPPTFDYQIDNAVLNSYNSEDPLVINPGFNTGAGVWTISVPYGATSVTVPNLALNLPYSFDVWTKAAHAAYQAANWFPYDSAQLTACLTTMVSAKTTVYAPSTAAVWGFADTHTHPFADDAYDTGNVFFHGHAFGPKYQVLGTDTKNPAHQAVDGVHMQNVGIAPTAGWPDFDKYPSYNLLSLDQSMYSDWLYRAFLGGMRLIVAHAVNNELMCVASASLGVIGSASVCNDMSAVDRQLNDARLMETYLNSQCNQVNPPRCLGPNKGWFHIVTSPQEARATINGGQLAVVLGIEVDRLFDCRASTTGYSDGSQDCTQLNSATAQWLTDQVSKYKGAGVSHVFIAHLSDSAYAGMALYDGGNGVPWGVNNTFENGQQGDFKALPCPSTSPDYTFDYNAVIQGANMQGEIGNMVVSALGFGLGPLGLPAFHTGYPVPTCNGGGLTDVGRFLVSLLVKSGIMIDMDHLSLATWRDPKGLESILRQTGNDPKYRPIVAGHTGPNAIGISRSERGLNDEQLEFLRRSGGLPAAGIEIGKASDGMEYKSSLGTRVTNNCDKSTTSLAQSYLYMVDAMGGPDHAAVALASDQSFNAFLAPRFSWGSRGELYAGWHTPEYDNGCNAVSEQSLLQSNPITYLRADPPFGGTISYYFGAQAGPGPTPPTVYLWTGERGYDLSAHRMWDFNTDGWAHVGLYPEMIQDLQNVGVKPQEMAPLFASAERYISAWQAYSTGGNPDTGVDAATGTVIQVPQDWVYFRGTDNKLWKFSNNQQIWIGNNTTISTPFVTPDGWVYFQGTDNTLWKVFNDGSGQKQIGTNTTKSMPFVRDGWVYFQGTDNTLWKASTDGSVQTQLGVNNTTSSTPFVTADGWVYFQGTDNTLWKISIGGTGQAKVGNNTTKSMPFVTPDGSVYFQGTDDTLWKISADGVQTKIGNNTTKSTPFVTPDGWVYFQGTDNTLWKVFNDGTRQSQIGTNTTGSMPFVTPDGWIYFQGTDTTLWKIFKDGSQQSPVGGNTTWSTPFVTRPYK